KVGNVLINQRFFEGFCEPNAWYERQQWARSSTPLVMPPSKPTGEVTHAARELVERVRSGDGSAFEALYRQHATRLYNLANRMVGSRADADGLLQDIFLIAFLKPASC